MSNDNIKLANPTMFVHYTDDGQVSLVSPVRSEQYNNFPVDITLLTDFLYGKKKARDFKIEYFYNLSKGVFEKEEEQLVKVASNFIYIIPRTLSYNNEITIEHDVANSKWNCAVRNDSKGFLEVTPYLTFFVCKDNNPYFLYRHFTVPATELINRPVEVPFITKQEEILSNISLATVKKFNSYGIKEIV